MYPCYVLIKPAAEKWTPGQALLEGASHDDCAQSLSLQNIAL